MALLSRKRDPVETCGVPRGSAPTLICPRCGSQSSVPMLLCPRCREPLSLGCSGDCSACSPKR